MFFHIIRNGESVELQSQRSSIHFTFLSLSIKSISVCWCLSLWARKKRFVWEYSKMFYKRARSPRYNQEHSLSKKSALFKKLSPFILTLSVYSWRAKRRSGARVSLWHQISGPRLKISDSSNVICNWGEWKSQTNYISIRDYYVEIFF